MLCERGPELQSRVPSIRAGTRNASAIRKPVPSVGSTSQAPRSKLLRLLNWCPRWPALFLLALLLPTDLSFYIGPLRLTLYRTILILSCYPAMSRVFSGRSGRVIFADWLVLVHMGWCLFVIAYYSGIEVCLQSGGVRFFEYAGAYFLARAYITDERTFQGVIAFTIVTVCLIFPWAVFESITGTNLILLVTSGGHFVSHIEKRWGFTRAFGTFDHPILLGVWAATALSVTWRRIFPQMGHPRPRKFLTIFVLLTAFASMSSGAIVSLMTQIMLMLWEAKTRLWRNRWRILLVLMVGVYIGVGLVAHHPPMIAILTHLAFSEANVYGRMIIFDYGMASIGRHPILGIGFNEWLHPTWMSGSMDNFWLVQAVTFGIPGFLTFALPAVLIPALGWRNLSSRITKLRTAWTISWIGIIIAGGTVDFWNNLFTYYAFFLGTGAWFLNVRRRAPE